MLSAGGRGIEVHDPVVGIPATSLASAPPARAFDQHTRPLADSAAVIGQRQPPLEALQPLDSGQAPEEVEGDELTPALSVRWTAGRAGIGRGYPLRRDGQGRIYVFPYVPRTWDRDDRPVDVYSPAGERLFAGMIPERSWLRSQGDFIYGIEVDAATDQARVLRYRLLAPF